MDPGAAIGHACPVSSHSSSRQLSGPSPSPPLQTAADPRPPLLPPACCVVQAPTGTTWLCGSGRWTTLSRTGSTLRVSWERTSAPTCERCRGAACGATSSRWCGAGLFSFLSKCNHSLLPASALLLLPTSGPKFTSELPLHPPFSDFFSSSCLQRAISESYGAVISLVTSEPANWVLRYMPNTTAPRRELFLTYIAPVSAASLPTFFQWGPGAGGVRPPPDLGAASLPVLLCQAAYLLFCSVCHICSHACPQVHYNAIRRRPLGDAVRNKLMRRHSRILRAIDQYQELHCIPENPSELAAVAEGR